MGNLKQVTKRPLNECVQQGTTTELRSFNAQEADSVAYFFLRLSNIYGREFRSQLPDEDSERISKREHGQYVCGYSRQEIDGGCNWIHKQKQNSVDGWQFLDIDRCTGAIKDAKKASEQRELSKRLPESRRIYSDAVKARQKRVNEEGLAALKDIL